MLGVVNPFALVALSLVPLLAQGPPVDVPIGDPMDVRLVKADAVVVARVDTLHPLPGTALELVEMSFERVLFGSAELKHAFALPPTSKSSKKANVLAQGQRYVLLLERPQLSSLTKAQAKAADALRQGAPLFTWPSDGVWPITDERVSVPGGLLSANDGPPGTEHGKSGEAVPEKELLDWLAARIAASLPSIRVREVTLSPLGGASFLVAPDGSVRGRRASVERLDEAGYRSLWRLLEEQRFAELPELVGSATQLEESIWCIEVRTRAGRHVVNFYGEGVDGRTASQRDAAERALRVLRALPIAAPTAGGPK